MSNPHEFLIGNDPIKEERRCPKCGSEPGYWDKNKCSLSIGKNLQGVLNELIR